MWIGEREKEEERQKETFKRKRSEICDNKRESFQVN